MRDTDGRMSTHSPGPTRWRDRAVDQQPDPLPHRGPPAWPEFRTGPDLRLGREIKRIDWPSSLYYWLDNALYVTTDGTRVGQYELSSGTNQLKPPRIFTEALHTFGPGNYWEINTYSGPLGDTALRDAVVNYENTVNRWHLARENVAVTYGAHEGLQVALRALRPRRRTALVLGPQVPLVFQALVQEGFRFRELWSADERALVPSVEEVLTALRRCTPDLLMLTSPNNPTGLTYPEDELEEIGSGAVAMGCALLVDKILSDSCLPGGPMSGGTCTRMGEWIESGQCLVVDSLSKRRAMSGLRSGYLLASAEMVKNHSVTELGGCPPLLLSTAAAADLNCSARLHVADADTAESDCRHAEDLRRMRATVDANFRLARDVLRDFWVWDSKKPGCLNCIVGLRTGRNSSDDREACARLFQRLVSCYPLSTFAADPLLMEQRRDTGLLELRLTCSMEPTRFEETLLRTRRALEALGRVAVTGG